MSNDEQTRYMEEFDGASVTMGDRIHPQIVAGEADRLGDPLDPEKDLPETKLLLVTKLNKHDDIYHALLLDPETKLLFRVDRHSSEAALTYREYDWKVRGIGTAIRVTDASVEYRPDDDAEKAESAYMQEWIDSLVDAVTLFEHYEVSNNWYLDGEWMNLLDKDAGRKGRVRIELVDER
jgi:hypothetical protein